jgi:uncharacterized protein
MLVDAPASGHDLPLPSEPPSPAAPTDLTARAALLQQHRAPRWLLGGRSGLGDGAWGGNLQTIWPALRSKRLRDGPLTWRRQRWGTPDGDFVDIDFSDRMGATVRDARPVPRLVLFHGLEGSSSSHYSQAFGDAARRLGWHYAVPHFRGCSGELNLAPRAYHSGDFEEIGWILDRLQRGWSSGHEPRPVGAATASAAWGPMVVVGISLGGNALLRWAEEMGHGGRRVAQAVAAVSSPIDLAAGGRAIGEGFNRLVYTRMFLRSMKPKALRKLQQHPGLFDAGRLAAARTLYEFDNVFTAPLHGFRDTEDYWRRASAKPWLGDIRLPALVLNARNDPFVPAACLPDACSLRTDWVTLAQPPHGGHVGFADGTPPGNVTTFADDICRWLAAAAGVPVASVPPDILATGPVARDG